MICAFPEMICCFSGNDLLIHLNMEKCVVIPLADSDDKSRTSLPAFRKLSLSGLILPLRLTGNILDSSLDLAPPKPNSITPLKKEQTLSSGGRISVLVFSTTSWPPMSLLCLFFPMLGNFQLATRRLTTSSNISKGNSLLVLAIGFRQASFVPSMTLDSLLR